MSNDNSEPSNFIRDIIDADLASGRHSSVVTRFPPEPNGYLHMGHAKSICLNFGLTQTYEGRTHLRFDDTNPTKEDIEYVESIQADIKWLGFDWGEHLYFSSDYFGRLYELAEKLIQDGNAYVCQLSLEDTRAYRGTLTEPGRPSPGRDRSAAENLELFRKMRDGGFAPGEAVLRAKVDMASPNMKMRDPLMYRILDAHHWRQGDTWKIYPLYDWTHGLSDSFEGVTHSICTLEFENNRELYDWFVAAAGVPVVPRQYEFARLALTYTVMSKRKLLQLVEDGHVDGWDDPRMPTIAGLRRRGVTPEAIRHFCDLVGVAKNNSVVDMGLFEFAIRNDLNTRARRVMAVLDPLEVVISGYPEDGASTRDGAYFPHDIGTPGTRPLPFSTRIFIERSDFAQVPAKRWHRLAPGVTVRLRHAEFITCQEVVKDDAGNVIRLECSWSEKAEGKVKGTIHWVSAEHSVPAEVRLYDRLFAHEAPGTGDADFLQQLNPTSLVVKQARVEPSLTEAPAGERFQFERQGYFAVDPDSTEGALRFNRIVTLKDTWGSTDKAAQPARRAKDARKSTRPGTLSQTPEEIVAADETLRAFFQAAVAVHGDKRVVANFVATEIARELKSRDTLPFDGAAVGALVKLVADGQVSKPAAKEVFAEMLETGDAPAAIVERKGLQKLSGGDELTVAIQGVLDAHPDEVERYRGGAKNLIGFFMGRVMKATRGKADAQESNRLIRQLLS